MYKFIFVFLVMFIVGCTSRVSTYELEAYKKLCKNEIDYIEVFSFFGSFPVNEVVCKDGTKHEVKTKYILTIDK